MVIAVTGASGFIGKELLDVLNNRDDISVKGLTRNAECASGYKDPDGVEWIVTDYSLDSLVKGA